MENRIATNDVLPVWDRHSYTVPYTNVQCLPSKHDSQNEGQNCEDLIFGIKEIINKEF